MIGHNLTHRIFSYENSLTCNNFRGGLCFFGGGIEEIKSYRNVKDKTEIWINIPQMKHKGRNLVIFKVNPFKERIVKVFSSSTSGDDSMTFEDFLDMMSVFSDNAPLSIKIEYAFRIYGTLSNFFFQK